MPGIRKPTNVLEIRGSFKKHPERRKERENEPRDDRELGECPGHLDEAQAQAWREIVEVAIPGVLVAADALTVEMAARLVARMRNGDVRASEFAILKGLLGAMGMTPADRSKIIMPKSESANRFDDD